MKDEIFRLQPSSFILQPSSLIRLPNRYSPGAARDPSLAVAIRHQLGADTHGDFGNGLRADVDTHRRMYLLQGGGRNALVLKVVEDQLDLSPTADQANVPRPTIGQMV